MNVVGKISLGLAAAALLGPVAHAAQEVSAAGDAAARLTTAASADQPYAQIIARNVFALLPPPPPVDPDAKPVDPPPKITANGITSILGQLQALFKVSFPAKAGQPAKDQSYMLSEGERQDDIEVTKIDEVAATITFDNHGTIQEIPLVVAKDTGSGPGPISGGPRNPFAPGAPGGFPSPRRPGGFAGVGTMGGVPAPMPQANNNNGNNNQAYQPDSDLAPEEQAVLIEAERARLLSMEDAAGNGSDVPSAKTGYYPPALLPPTKYSPPDALGTGTGPAATGSVNP
jgi:hypothetical protein